MVGHEHRQSRDVAGSRSNIMRISAWPSTEKASPRLVCSCNIEARIEFYVARAIPLDGPGASRGPPTDYRHRPLRTGVNFRDAMDGISL
jgi:hypothetical protein